MRSVKVKLISLIAMICLVAGIMLVGIFAAQTQQIKLNGQVNFEIGDKSLYVKDVRMQENMDTSTIYSLKDNGRFMPGYVNGEFNMNLGNFTNTYGSFALYFDVINTMDETSGETFEYTAKPSTTQSGVTVTTAILDSNGSSISQIPQGTLKPSEITSSSPISATIKLTVSGISGANVDLSQIMITISQYIVPQVYDYFDFKVNSDGTTVTLTEFNESLADTDIVIPDTVSYVDGVWMDGDTYAVTSIGNEAFYVCGLTSIDLSNCTSLTSIGMRAFSDCYVLTSIILPSSLTSIGDYAFSECQSLAEVELSNCTNLTSIGENAFAACGGLIGALDLSNCTRLTSIGMRAFSSCSGLESITLPSSLTSIGENAFAACGGLTEVDLSNCTSLTSIGSGAFWLCSGLTSITLPSNLTSIGEMAFDSCSGLESIIVEEGNPVYHSADNCVIETESNTLVLGCKNSIIPSYITSIGDYAFYNCSGLTELDLSNCTSLTSIGEMAFYGCHGLTSITFPNTTGWYATTSSSATSGDPMDMSDPVQNATWLTADYNEDYYRYYFKRNV